MRKDVTIAFRTVGERTEQLCINRLAQEVPEKNIQITRNLPLHESTRVVCEKAVGAGKKYTIMIGADYIPRVGMIQDLCEMADQMTGDWLFVKGTIIDKFLMELRGDMGGPMLYPTKLLEGWLQILPNIENKTTTEASCQSYYKQKGYRVLRAKTWLALHDFEQHYRDIYRSMFVGGRKHNKFRPILIPRWRARSQEDPDFKVAEYAHMEGHLYNQRQRRRGIIEADFRKDYGWLKSPFCHWTKEPLDPDADYDVHKFAHLAYENQKGKVI